MLVGGTVALVCCCWVVRWGASPVDAVAAGVGACVVGEFCCCVSGRAVLGWVVGLLTFGAGVALGGAVGNFASRRVMRVGVGLSAKSERRGSRLKLNRKFTPTAVTIMKKISKG